MDLMVGGQLCDGFFFLQHFETNLDLQVSGRVFADRFHNVLKPPMVFCLDSAIHYNIVLDLLPRLLPFIAWILIPIESPGVRIVLTIAPSPKHLNFLGSSRSFSPEAMGWNLPDGTFPKEIQKSSWITLPTELFERIKSDPSLTISDLDEILGISGRSDSTWNLVLRKAKEAGLNPEEVAERLGLSE